MEGLRKTGDKHTIYNLDWSGEFIWAYMYLPITTKVLDHVSVAASGPDIMVVLIIVICDYNFEIVDKVKDKMVATKLSGFPGENT